MEELTKSLKAFYYDRNASPLSGAFAVAWAIINFEVVLIVLSGTPVQKKLGMINKHFANGTVENLIGKLDLEGWVLYGTIYPLLLAVAYIAIYPFPARLAYDWTLKMQLKLRELRQKIEEQKLISAKEFEQYERERREEKVRSDKMLDDSRSRIKMLSEELDRAQDNAKNQSEMIDTLREQYTTSSEELAQLRELQQKEVSQLREQLGSTQETVQQRDDTIAKLQDDLATAPTKETIAALNS